MCHLIYHHNILLYTIILSFQNLYPISPQTYITFVAIKLNGGAVATSVTVLFSLSERIRAWEGGHSTAGTAALLLELGAFPATGGWGIFQGAVEEPLESGVMPHIGPGEGWGKG